MKIINPSFEIWTDFDGEDVLKLIERATRVAYKSEDKICPGSAKDIIMRILNSTPPHESTIEHFQVTVKVICDRGVTHEIVRHRIGSYTQESTRYCNYSKDKFGSEITVIKPFFFDNSKAGYVDFKEKIDRYYEWEEAMLDAEKHYMRLLDLGATPQEARTVLPNSLKTEIVITFNLREWRHFFHLRAGKKAHPQMREIAVPMLEEFHRRIPVLFDDLYEKLCVKE